MSSRPNRVLAIVVGVVAAVGLVAGVLAATRDVPMLDRGTPEGVVQAYLTAVVDRDHEAAIGFLVAGSPCTVADLDLAYVPDDVRVVLRDSAVDGTTARVRVDVVVSEGGPFGGGGFAEQHTFRLREADGEWRIAGRPWPMYDCGTVR